MIILKFIVQDVLKLQDMHFESYSVVSFENFYISTLHPAYCPFIASCQLEDR